jgi:conjugal transfer mating pair stabilization protein TraG
MDIAMGYSRGGSVDQRHITADSPLRPSRISDAPWPGSELDGEPIEAKRKDVDLRPSNAQMLAEQRQQNEASVLQARESAAVGEGESRRPIDRSPSARARAFKDSVGAEVEKQGAAVKLHQGSMDETYNSKVQVNNIRRDHGGNPAVWDTVGADARNRPSLGQKTPNQPKP